MSSSEAKHQDFEGAYRTMVQSAREMIAIVQEGQFRYANPATSTMLGYSLEELYQMSFLDLVAPSDREAATELCVPPLNYQQAPRYEMDVIRKDGQPVPLEIIPSPITYEGQPAVQLVGRDITEHKRLCEHWVQSEKLAALGRFVSAVAHELNNPLTVIVGFAEILLSHLNLNEQDQADLEMIASEAHRARQMIYDLLMLSREQPQQKQSVDLNHLIAITLEHHQADLQASHIQVITEPASDLPPVWADPNQLKQVFTHIISHIRKSLTATRGGGTLRVSTAAKRVRARAGWTGVAQITFADNGPTRSPDDLRQIFEPGYSSREEDRGLGLALAYNLINQHGGQLYALSPPGEGVNFIIELPVKVSHQPSAVSRQPHDE